MAKKVVATLKKIESKKMTKVIKITKSNKSNFYTFNEKMIPSDKINSLIKK